MSEIDDLPPCPFCGDVHKWSTARDLHWGLCENIVCGNVIIFSAFSDAEKTVLTQKWKTRPIETALRTEVARLEAENAGLTGTLSFIYTLASRATLAAGVGTFVEIMTRIEEVFDKPQGGLTATVERDANGVEYLRVDEVKE